MKSKSKFDMIMETADSTGKWGVACLVIGIVTAAVGMLIGAFQIVCGATLLRRKKELSDAA